MQYILSKDNARPQCDDKDNVLKTLSLIKSDDEFIYLDQPFTIPLVLPRYWDIKELYEYCFERGYILNKVYEV